MRGPVLLPPCSRQRPFAMAGALHVPPPLRRFAPQRGHASATARPGFHEGRRGSLHILTTFPPVAHPTPGPHFRTDRPDCVAIEASRDRLELADKAGALEMGLDLDDTIQADNS